MAAEPFLGSNGTFGKGRGSGGDGGDPGDDPLIPAVPESDKSRILTGFLLVVVGMTFAGLFGAYIVLATNRALEWRPFALPYQVWVSSLLIAVSSVTYHLGKISIDKERVRAARKWMLATSVLGGMFIASQLLVWMQLRAKGFYMEGNPYTGFFYILTATHAVHVIGGIVALGSVVLSLGAGGQFVLDHEKVRSNARVIGWYWHFMGIIWTLILVLLGFWR
jgi:cytochrome c oxidase subunit 3